MKQFRQSFRTEGLGDMGVHSRGQAGFHIFVIGGVFLQYLAIKMLYA